MHRWIEHTGEQELVIEARSCEAVFSEALAALGELIADERDGERITREVRLAESDRPALLAEWLNELVYLAETDGLVPEGVESMELSENGLRATITGVRAWPRNLVKAVTYHRLELARHGDVWRARVTLDV